MGADMIATGHYAKIAKYKDHFVLDTPKIAQKTKAIFYALSSEQLTSCYVSTWRFNKKRLRDSKSCIIFLVSDKRIVLESVLLEIKNLMSLLLNTYKQFQVILLMKMEKF